MRLFSLIFVCIYITTVNAQKWVDFGLKGYYGPNLLLSSGIFDETGYNHELKMGGGFGAKIGFNFDQANEITFDVGLNNFRQDFDYNLIDASDVSTSYVSSLRFRSLEMFLMYRNNKDGRYFEVGPLLSRIQSSSRTDSFYGVDAADPFFSSSTLDPKQTGLAFGFGSYVLGTENFGVTMGFRMAYLMTDLFSSEGKGMNYPFGPSYYTQPETSSNPLYVQLIFEANFDLAYLARAQCGRTKILTF